MLKLSANTITKLIKTYYKQAQLRAEADRLECFNENW